MNNIEPKLFYHGAMTLRKLEGKKIRELSFPIPFKRVLVTHLQCLFLLDISPTEEGIILVKLKEG